jgi:hypothetical protein
MILVIAANYQGFLHFCQQWNLNRSTTRYVGSIDVLRGLENRLVLLAPGWWMGRGGSDFVKSMDAAGLDTSE